MACPSSEEELVIVLLTRVGDYRLLKSHGTNRPNKNVRINDIGIVDAPVHDHGVEIILVCGEQFESKLKVACFIDRRFRLNGCTAKPDESSAYRWDVFDNENDHKNPLKKYCLNPQLKVTYHQRATIVLPQNTNYFTIHQIIVPIDLIQFEDLNSDILT